MLKIFNFLLSVAVPEKENFQCLHHRKNELLITQIECEENFH